MSRNKSLQFDEELKIAYQKAIYRIFTPPLQWKIGDSSVEIDILLKNNTVTSAIFISACNPFSQICSLEENEQQTAALAEWLKQQQLPFILGQGEDPDGIWPPEKSFLVLGGNASDGKSMGQKWQQNAVVFLKTGQAVELLWC